MSGKNYPAEIYFLTKTTMNKKTSFFHMTFKEATVKDGKIRIKGFASTPEIDRYDDIVNPAAFSGAMETYMKNPVVLLQHNGEKVLGQVVDYAISAKGLEVTAELTNDIDNCFQNILDKNLRGFSIGFICKKWNMRDEGDRQIREITDLDLIEISVVSTPANASSLFTLSKSIKAFFSDIDKAEAKACGDMPEGEDDDEEEDKKKKKESENEAPVAPAEAPAPETPEGETPEAPATETESKTEKEAPTGEAPVTPATEDVPASDKSEPVEAGEKPTEENPTPSAEVEALNSKVEELTAELEAEKAKNAEILKKLEASEAKNAESEAKYAKLEKEYLSIEVKPGTKTAKTILERRSVVVSDEAVMRLIARR